MTNHATFRPGFTLTELIALFGETRSKIVTAVSGVVANGKKGPHATYPLLKVAIRLARDELVDEEVVEHVLRLDPEDLPAKLKKAYWDGQSSKLRYQREAGDVWPTEKVVEFAGETFKTLRLSLQLFTDSLDRETGLTEKQRLLIQAMIDGALNDMRERLIDVFESKRASDDGAKVDIAPEDDDTEEL